MDWTSWLQILKKTNKQTNEVGCYNTICVYDKYMYDQPSKSRYYFAVHGSNQESKMPNIKIITMEHNCRSIRAGEEGEEWC